MAKGNLEARIEQVREIGRQPLNDDSLAALRKALGDRSNLIAAQAARVVGELRLRDLTADIVAAFDRMLQKGVAADPKCWGKKAMIDALKKMDHDDSAPFLKGLRHVQMEPVWGGQEDTAAALRSSCALALSQCGDISRHTKLRHLVDAMADAQEPVRIDVVRAIAQMEGDDGILLLRLLARVGDPKPRVTGQVFESIISVEGERGADFVAGFLESARDEIYEEAALALGGSRVPAAFEVLKTAWSQDPDKNRREILLRAVSASGLPAAIDFLVELIQNGLKREADAAVQALNLYADSEEIQQRVRAAVKQRKDR